MSRLAARDQHPKRFQHLRRGLGFGISKVYAAGDQHLYSSTTCPFHSTTMRVSSAPRVSGLSRRVSSAPRVVGAQPGLRRGGRRRYAPSSPQLYPSYPQPAPNLQPSQCPSSQRRAQLQLSFSSASAQLQLSATLDQVVCRRRLVGGLVGTTHGSEARPGVAHAGACPKPGP